MLKLLCVAASLFFTTSAASHDLRRYNLGNGEDEKSILAAYASREEGIYFSVTDRVKDGCWPSPRAAREELHFQSQLRGWKLNNIEEKRFVEVVISVSGRAIAPDYCIANASFEGKLGFPVILDQTFYSGQAITFFSADALIWSYKTDAPKHIENMLLEMFQELMSFIDKAKAR